MGISPVSALIAHIGTCIIPRTLGIRSKGHIYAMAFIIYNKDDILS